MTIGLVMRFCRKRNYIGSVEGAVLLQIFKITEKFKKVARKYFCCYHIHCAHCSHCYLFISYCLAHFSWWSNFEVEWRKILKVLKSWSEFRSVAFEKNNFYYHKMPFRSFAILFVFVVLKNFTCEAAVKKVPCQSINTNRDWGSGNKKTCWMRESTIIDTRGFTIASAKDKNIFGLDMAFNKNIFFLPVNVYEQFPNLVGLDAGVCSIKTIFKENFKNLNKLKILILHHQPIETIPNNVFEDLVSLELLWLRKEYLF